MTNKDDIAALLEEIQTFNDLINQDLSAWDPNTYPGKSSQQGEAKKNLPALKAKYLDYLQDAALVMVLSGTQNSQTKFAEIAAEEGNTVTVDAKALYLKLSEGIEESLGYTREFGVTQLSLVINGIRDICLDLGIRETDRPRHLEQVVVLTQADIVDHIRKIVRESDSDFLNVKYMSNTLLQQGLSKRYNQSVVPVVIMNASEEEAKALSQFWSKPYANVQVPSFASTEEYQKFVLEIFTNVKKSSKRKPVESTPEV